MSMVIEKESGIVNKFYWRGLSLSRTSIQGLIGSGYRETRMPDKNDSSTGIFAMFFKNRIISVYCDMNSRKVGVWDAKEDKS